MGPLSTDERDVGLARVESTNQRWLDRAWNELLRCAKVAAEDGSIEDLRFTGEDVRYTLHKVVGEPSHHNCWGALIMRAVRSKPPVLIRTGGTSHCVGVRSHARRLQVYRFAGED